MMTFNNEPEIFAYFEASVPGYIPGTLHPGGLMFPMREVNGVEYHSRMWVYLQTVPSGGTYQERECFIEASTAGSYKVVFPTISETPEGHTKVVSSYSGPDEFYPWVFSIFGHMARDGSDAVKVREDGSPAQEGDVDANLYFKKSVSHVLTYELGFQNIVACWARFNEGDCSDLFVDVPGAMAAYQAQQQGADANTVAYLNSLEWYQFAQFGEDITMFGTNEKGTPYPPTQSPALSWLPIGARIRVDIYKKVIDDPWYRLGANETEVTHPEKLGPFLDLDILGQRRR